MIRYFFLLFFIASCNLTSCYGVYPAAEANSTYDALGRLLSVELPTVLDRWDSPYRPMMKRSYNARDRIMQISDFNGGLTEIAYTDEGAPAEIIYPDGSRETFLYNLDGSLKQKTNRDGSTISYAADETGLLTGAEYHSPAGKLLPFIESDDSSLLDDPASDPPLSDFFHTDTHKTTNALGQEVKQIEQVDGYGIRQVHTYDALDRLESSIKYNAMGGKLSENRMRYDGNGNKVLEECTVLSKGVPLRTFSISRTYDLCNRLLSIVESGAGMSKTTQYRYFPSGKLAEIIKPDGTRILHEYNEDGLLSYYAASDQSFAYRYCYDNSQRLATIQDLCHDRLQTRTYHSSNQLAQEVQSGGLAVAWNYDSTGKRIGIVLPDQSKILYHFQGDVLSAVERRDAKGQPRYVHTYAYDQEGRIAKHQLPFALGSIDWEYGAQGKPLKITSQWWSQEIPADAFDPYDRLQTSKIKDSGRIHISTYEYADDGQLARDNADTYTYDSLYNRLSKNGQLWETDGLNRLVRTPQGPCKYDPNGNLIEKESDGKRLFYTYDALDRLIRVESSAAHVAVSYIYDAFDRRIEAHEWQRNSAQDPWLLQTVSYFLYDGLVEIGRADAQGTLKELRVLGSGKAAEVGAAVMLEFNGKQYLPLHDFTGSIRCLIDTETRTIAETYSYKAFGEEEIYDVEGFSYDTSPVGNPWRYCSKRTDPLSQLVFFGKRHYDPILGRWITPDPLFDCDTLNLYAFVKNDSINRYDAHGLYSISERWDNWVKSFFSYFHYLQHCALTLKAKVQAELRLPKEWANRFETIGKAILGESTYILMGHHHEETMMGCFGEQNVNERVRITFINGILTTRKMMQGNLELLSSSHGGAKIHYVFRPTEGWTWDISRTLMIKMAFSFGFRSKHAYLLAQLWRELIEEVGGVGSDGVIIHYAHSLGGTETDRARDLLTPEEQKMIRVVTFGSATFVRNVGFQNVVNHISIDDGVGNNFLFDPVGNVRYYLDSAINVRYHGSPLSFPRWPADHGVTGPTYGPIIKELGKEFLTEFGLAIKETNS